MVDSAEDGRHVESTLIELRARSRRRWLVTFVCVGIFPGLLGGLLGGLIPQLFGSRHHHTHRQHGAGPAGLLIAGAVIFISVVVLIVILRLTLRDKGMFRAPLTAGLPRAQRRQVNRAIRRARPSAGPLLRHVEIDTARRTPKRTRVSLVIFGLLLVLELTEAIFGDNSTAGRVFYAAAAVLFAVGLIVALRTDSDARRYLRVVETGSHSEASGG